MYSTAPRRHSIVGCTCGANAAPEYSAALPSAHTAAFFTFIDAVRTDSAPRSSFSSSSSSSSSSSPPAASASPSSPSSKSPSSSSSPSRLKPWPPASSSSESNASTPSSFEMISHRCGTSVARHGANFSPIALEMLA